MYKNLFFGLLAGLFLFAFSSHSMAQDVTKDYNRELYLGTAIGGGFAPRILYKIVNEKSVTRFSLKMSSMGRSQGLSYEGDGDTYDEIKNLVSLNLDFGLGLEWRTPVNDKFQIYYGGDLRILYALNKNKRRREPIFDPNNPTNGLEGNSISHSPGLGLGAFVGFRYSLNPRIALSVEAGPSLSGVVNFHRRENIIVQDAGTPNETEVVNAISQATLTGQFSIISPIYLQFSLHF